MRMSRFYCPDLSVDAHEVVLPQAVHRHAVQVLRLKTGSLIRLFNGKGLEVEATIGHIEKRHSQATIQAIVTNDTESPLPITLLQGISRGERMDFAIQKAVELGVTSIVPVITERCNVQLKGVRADKRHQHWQGVMISACEQSGRAQLPQLHEVSDLATALAASQDELKLVLEPQAEHGFMHLAKPTSLTLLIGPEGGVSDQEISTAQQHGFTAVRFGPRILRTETATVAALAVMQTLWGDLG